MRTASLQNLQTVYLGDAVRAAERIAMSRFGLDEDDLMARAGLAAWRLLLERWPQAQRIGVACGPGNNGGDGYVLAALALGSGRQVSVVRLGEGGKAGVAQRAEAVYRQTGGQVGAFSADVALPPVDLWVDALFGIGLRRALDGPAADLVHALNRGARERGMPSGVGADTGDDHGLSIRADVTLGFIAGKPGLYTGRGRVAAGEVVVDALGLADHLFDDLEPAARIARADALPRCFAPRERDAHKGHFGHALCIGGDHGYGGALALCAEAAHRTGAGLVSAATRAAHVPVLLARRPETMVHAVDDGDALQPLLERATVLAIGPGLGGSEWSASLLHAATSAGKPTVFDADALNAIARRDAGPLRDAVLTPHPGEAARLLGTTTDAIASDRLRHARQLAARFDCTVVLKGAGTVVAAPGQVPILIDAGNPGMATGGMGDVLTGVIAGLIAQGAAPFDAAACGALLHAVAGDAAARDGGERGLLPSDLFAHVRALANPDARA
jgi:NAD(P)H-hydrate epimerase